MHVSFIFFLLFSQCDLINFQFARWHTTLPKSHIPNINILISYNTICTSNITSNSHNNNNLPLILSILLIYTTIKSQPISCPLCLKTCRTCRNNSNFNITRQTRKPYTSTPSQHITTARHSNTSICHSNWCHLQGLRQQQQLLLTSFTSTPPALSPSMAQSRLTSANIITSVVLAAPISPALVTRVAEVTFHTVPPFILLIRAIMLIPHSSNFCQMEWILRHRVDRIKRLSSLWTHRSTNRTYLITQVLLKNYTSVFYFFSFIYFQINFSTPSFDFFAHVVHDYLSCFVSCDWRKYVKGSSFFRLIKILSILFLRFRTFRCWNHSTRISPVISELRIAASTARGCRQWQQ